MPRKGQDNDSSLFTSLPPGTSPYPFSIHPSQTHPDLLGKEHFGLHWLSSTQPQHSIPTKDQTFLWILSKPGLHWELSCPGTGQDAEASQGHAEAQLPEAQPHFSFWLKKGSRELFKYFNIPG